MEADRVILQLRCRNYEITKIRPLRVSCEISGLIGNDFKITLFRDSLKLECLEQLDSKDLVVGRFEEKVLIKGVVHRIKIGDEEVLKSDFSVEGSPRIHIEDVKRIGRTKSLVIF